MNKHKLPHDVVFEYKITNGRRHKYYSIFLSISFLFLFNINHILITRVSSDKINAVKESINEPKNGADLIFFGNNVHKDSEIEDALKTSSALGAQAVNTIQY